jgi:hypothetical protein
MTNDHQRMSSSFFCDLLPGGATGFIEIRLLKKGQPEATTRKWFPVSKERDAQQFAWAAEVTGHDAYFGVLPRRRRGSKKADVQDEANVLWADIDTANSGWNIDLYRDVLNGLPASTKPSVVVKSGGGLHLYWKLSTPIVGADNIEAANRVMAEAFSGDNVGDIARIMRVPGSFNFKRGAYSCCDGGSMSAYDPAKLLAAVKNHGPVYSGPMSKGFPFREYQPSQRIAAYWGQLVRMGGVNGFIGADAAISSTTAFLHGKGYPDDQIVNVVWGHLVKRAATDKPGLVLDEKAERRKIKDKLDRYKPKKVQRDAERKSAKNPFAGLKVAPVPGWFGK